MRPCRSSGLAAAAGGYIIRPYRVRQNIAVHLVGARIARPAQASGRLIAAPTGTINKNCPRRNCGGGFAAFLDLSPAFQGAEEGHLIGIFQLASHGDSVGQAGDLHLQGL